jgi:Uma2 family endonuclease
MRVRAILPPLYTASSIAEYWLVDLDEEAVTVYRHQQTC